MSTHTQTADKNIDIKLRLSAIPVSGITDRLIKHSHNVGGICSFLGLVREFNDGKPIKVLSLEHYPAMAEKQLHAIAETAMAQWHDVSQVHITHRYGDLKPKEAIVLVIAAAEHRKNAFQAAEFIIDSLKTKIPFWKTEIDNLNRTRQIHSKPSDYEAMKRW